MKTSRTWVIALGLSVSGWACATHQSNRPAPHHPESVATVDPRHGIPPATRESDPDVTEQRFGFGEARARREEKARADAQAANHVDVVDVEEPPKAKPVDEKATPPAAQPATDKACCEDAPKK